MDWIVEFDDDFEAEFRTFEAIVLVAGDKSGGSQKAFSRRLIARADRRFSAHLENLRFANEDQLTWQEP